MLLVGKHGEGLAVQAAVVDGPMQRIMRRLQPIDISVVGNGNDSMRLCKDLSGGKKSIS